MSDYPGYSASQDRTMPAVAYGLYFLGIPSFGLATIAGVIVAHSHRSAADPVAESHYTYLVRTFWLGIAWCLAWGAVAAVSFPLSFILIGIPTLVVSLLALKLTIVWYLVRLVVGVIYLARGEAHPRPNALLA
jgi:uncharacterized membrane protein